MDLSGSDLSELGKYRTPQKSLPMETTQMPEPTIETSSDEEETPRPESSFVDSGAI